MVLLPPPPCSAIRELNGESPCFGSSTTTMVPILTRIYRPITSSLGLRRQPGQIDAPIYFALGRMPRRPLGHAADLGDAGPRHGFLADGDAVADRLAAIQH